MTAWKESVATRGFDWKANGIIKWFGSYFRGIICNFDSHSIRANECVFFPLPLLLQARVEPGTYLRKINVSQDFFLTIQSAEALVPWF